MLKFLLATFLSVALALSVYTWTGTQKVYAKNGGEVPVKQHLEMLYPTVLVAIGGASGSGTVIFSDIHEDEYSSLVLTNWHVVRSAITVSKEWDSQRQEKIEKETRRPVKIEIFEYNNYSKSIGTTGRTAAIVAYDKKRDLALLRIDDRERPIDHVAVLYPEDEDTGPWIFQKAWAVGAGLGKPPFPTQGLLSGFAKDSYGYDLILGSAPIIFGNSGGSGYVMSPRGVYELIGVPSMVSGYGWGSVVSHMGWWRPISQIRIFLREHNYGYVLGDEPIESEEDSINN